MPRVFYAVPHIGASNTDRMYSQKGPTCWYYAAKMLLKYHGLLDPRVESIYRSFKALSQLRKELTKLGEQGIKTHIKLGNKYAVDPMVTQLNKANVAVAEERRLKKLEIRQLLNSLATVSKVASSMLSAQFLKEMSDLLLSLNKDLDKIETRLSDINRTISVLSRRRHEVVYGCSLLTTFFQPNFFTAVEIPWGKAKWQKTADELYFVLDNNGPVYAVGDLLIEQGAKTSFGPLDVSYATTTAFKANAPHAILVVGIDTDADYVYYKDPNFSNSVLKAKVSEFMHALSHTWLGGSPSLYGTVKCPKFDAHGAEYCEHVRLSKKAFNKFVRENDWAPDFDDDFGEFQSATSPPTLMLTYYG